jgi:Ca2+-binding EF-hand superfamily protein
MKTLSKYIAATAVVASLIGSAGFAYAQTNSVPAAEQTLPNKHFADRQARHEKMIDKMFAKFDAGKTGAITIDAFLKGPDARFDKIDTKKQGFLDHDELQAYFGARDPQMVDRLMKRLDTDNDGKISKAEFEKPLRKRFALLDLNDDGKITREEASLAGPMMMPHGHGKWQNRHHMNNEQPTAQ